MKTGCPNESSENMGCMWSGRGGKNEIFPGDVIYVCHLKLTPFNIFIHEVRVVSEYGL